MPVWLRHVSHRERERDKKGKELYLLPLDQQSGCRPFSGPSRATLRGWRELWHETDQGLPITIVDIGNMMLPEDIPSSSLAILSSQKLINLRGPGCWAFTVGVLQGFGSVLASYGYTDGFRPKSEYVSGFRRPSITDPDPYSLLFLLLFSCRFLRTPKIVLSFSLRVF